MELFGKMSFFLLLLISPIFRHGVVRGEIADSHGDHHVGPGVDPFEEVLHKYNISQSELDASWISRIADDFADKLHCDPDATAIDQNCSKPFCVVISPNLIGGDSTSVSEDFFHKIAASLVVLATRVSSATCGTSVTLNTSLLTAHQEDMTSLLKYDVTGSDVLNALQNALELMPLEASETHDESDHHGDHEEHEEEEEEEEDHDHSDHADEHTEVETTEDNCFGADILYDVLGHDVYDLEDRPEIGPLASHVLLNVLNGAHVERDCRILPRESFFIHDVFERFHTENDVINREGFARLLEEMEIGGVHADDTDHVDEHAGHGHKRRRRSTTWPLNKWNTTCYNGDQLWASYKLPDGGLTMEHLADLCPALIQQIVSGSCKEQTMPETMTESAPSVSEKYGFGTLATFIVCLCSVVGVIFVKCCHDKVYHTVIELFLGLAVGTLLTDSLLHLIPMALGVHSEAAHDHSSGGPIEVEEYVWYSLVIATGIYTFYLLEKIFTVHGGSHAHTPYFEKEIVNEKKCSHDNEAFDHEQNGKTQYSFNNIEETRTGKDKGTSSVKQGMKPVVLMVLLGDAIHNFADGMAIGASFSKDKSLGLSTTIAVFFHELPHELGDTAILLSSGLSLGRTLFLNFLSSLTAMIGLYVGLAVSTDETVQRWIMSAAAGMFIYIALVDMLPQLIHSRGRTLGMFLLNNVGILVGALCMVLLAVFESKIHV